MASKATLVLIPSDLVFAGKWANGLCFVARLLSHLFVIFIYSCFEKGCLTNGEKLTRQC